VQKPEVVPREGQLELEEDAGSIISISTGERMVVLPAEAWDEMVADIYSAFHAGARPLLLQLGFRLGVHLVAKAAELTHARREALTEVAQEWQGIGGGTLELSGDLRSGRRLSVTVRNCGMCTRNYPGVASHGCDFVEGVAQGVVEGLYGIRYASSEVECASKGAGTCRFELVESREHDRWPLGTRVMFPWV